MDLANICTHCTVAAPHNTNEKTECCTLARRTAVHSDTDGYTKIPGKRFVVGSSGAGLDMSAQ